VASCRRAPTRSNAVQAYQNNPSLNAQRAALRAIDENVPQALSGYRPKLSVTASGGFNYFNQVNKAVNQQTFPHSVGYSSLAEDLGTRQFGATATQTRMERDYSSIATS
jgi:outer membrane protein